MKNPSARTGRLLERDAEEQPGTSNGSFEPEQLSKFEDEGGFCGFSPPDLPSSSEGQAENGDGGAAISRVRQLEMELAASRFSLQAATVNLETLKQSEADLRKEMDDTKAIQSALRSSEIHYRRLFEAARDGILIVDPDTRKITDCNPFMQELLDYPRDELLGKELWQIGLLKDEVASQEAFRELQDKGYIRYDDLPLETKTGLRREVEFVSNLYGEDSVSVIQCNVRDISARKLTERALAMAKDEISQHAAQLEANVAERTARLRETIGELEMFSYSVAHDMRAPLRAMASFAQILMEDFGKDLPPEARGHVAYITAAAVRMDELIQDVLTYTTILNSEMKVSVVDLDILVRQVIQTYPQLHTGDVQIEIEGLLPKVLGHPATMAQCISNVLTNAVKFIASGTRPRVRIRAVALHSYIRLWVEDNGIGIDPKDHKRIFGMFERVNNNYEGTGIGLAIVRKSIERLRGNVGVESALGEGSRFWVEFRRI